MSATASIATKRLMQERAEWRKEKPFGFVAKFATNADNNGFNVFKWECIIPGKKDGLWEGGEYKLIMEFPEEYPGKPPKCRFETVLFHPNIYPSGTVCLSILNEDEDWKPSITVKQLLLGIQDLLDHPNPLSPAQAQPLQLFQNNLQEYERRVREQVKSLTPSSE